MNYNISASYFRGYGFLDKVSQSRAKSMEKLSSGYRITQASDDSAGSAMTSIMRSQIRGLQQATRNSDDAIELLNSADSGLGEIASILQRIRELGVRSANDTLTPADRSAVQGEVDHLLTEIDRIAKTTEYNGIKLLNNEPEAAGLGRGLAYLVGKENITPDGNLSESYDTWQMLDPSTQGANATNNVYRTLEEIFRTPASRENKNIYQAFKNANGSYYSGDIFDAAGNKLGNVSRSNAIATLDAAASTILPENPVSKSVSPYIDEERHYNYITPNTTTASTYEKYLNQQRTATVSSSTSAVYGKDASGNLVSLSYERYNADYEKGTCYSVFDDYQKPLAAVTIDFKMYNTSGGFSNGDLYGTGFNSTCATCHNHYSIKFVQGTESNLNTFSTSSTDQHYTLELGIDALPSGASGEDLAEFVVNTIKQHPSFAGHFTQYAFSGSTLYVFDNRTDTLNNSGRMDSFAAISFEDTLVKAQTYTPMKVQAGANAYQVVGIELPYISVETLGIKDIDLRDGASATESLLYLDSAIQYVTMERSKLGTYRNRLEHVSNVDDISALATTDSESKIHDTDFSSEILNLTKAQVLEEYGVNSVAEINKMIENVLEFIK